MGEVFRATETRLGREVAVKVLPGAVASHSDRFDSGLAFMEADPLLHSLHADPRWGAFLHKMGLAV